MKKLILLLVTTFAVSEAAFCDNRPLPGSNPPSDNSAVNSGTSDDAPIKNPPRVQADNQRNNPAELELVAKIRQDIMRDDSLSIPSQNITVVSKGKTSVSLRGEVPSVEEKDKLVAIAKKHASSVTEEITIKG